MITESAKTVARASQGSGPRQCAELQQEFERLLCRLPWPAATSDSPLRTLGITSCRGAEGVSSVAAHLATAAATVGDGRVLLVDANFADPNVSRVFGVHPYPGLAEVCQGGGELSEAVQSSDVANLALLTAGRPAGGQCPLGEKAEMPQLVRDLASDFDLVVFDLPPVGRSSMALRLSASLDGVLLVVETGRTSAQVARHTSESLVQAGAHLLGVVLNKWQQQVPAWLARI